MEYKDTPVGMIPIDWDIARLGDEDISTLIMGQSPPSSTYNKEGNGLPFLQGKAEFGDMHPNPVLSCTDPMKIAEKDDLLLSIRAPVGEVNIATEKYCIGRGLAAIRTKKDKLDNIFLFNYVKISDRRFEVLSTGSTFKAIKKGDIENFVIPVPPLSEQQKIAEILSTTDEAIKKSDKIIAKVERIKDGMMQKLLTVGIGHDEFKDTPIGKMPANWELSPLKKIINLKSGQYFKFSEFSDDGVKCLKIDNVGFGNVEWDTTTYLPENYLDQYPELVLKEGDIVIALNRPIIRNKLKIGILKQTDDPSILYQRVGKLIFKNMEIDKNYLFYYLKGEYFKNQLSKYLIGTDQPYIRTPVFLGIKIPLPSLSEQERIAEIMSSIDAKLNKEIKRKIRLQSIKKGLMNDLLTGRKRVHINN